MQRIIHISIGLLCGIIGIGCQSGDKRLNEKNHCNAELSAVIEGRQLNSDLYSNLKSIELVIEDFRGQQVEFIADITEKGTFRFVFYPKTKREVKLRPIEEVMIVAPGDSIYIVKDFKDIASTRFSGKGALINQNISAFRNQYLGRYVYSFDTPYQEYKSLCEQEKEEAIAKIEKFKAENETSDDFEYWALKQIEIDLSKALFDYLSRSSYRNGVTFEEQEGYLDFAKNLEDHFDDDIVLSDYFNIASILLALKMKPHFKTKEYPDVLNLGKDFMHELMSGENDFLNQFLLYAFLNKGLDNNNLQLVDENRAFIDTHLTNPFLALKLQERYSYVKEYIETPKLRSDAIIGEQNNDRMGGEALLPQQPNLIRNVIQKHRGKVLYMDVWALWCLPCLANMKYSKQLMNHFESEDVEFVFLCFNQWFVIKFIKLSRNFPPFQQLVYDSFIFFKVRVDREPLNKSIEQ